MPCWPKPGSGTWRADSCRSQWASSVKRRPPLLEIAKQAPICRWRIWIQALTKRWQRRQKKIHAHMSTATIRRRTIKKQKSRMRQRISTGQMTLKGKRNAKITSRWFTLFINIWAAKRRHCWCTFRRDGWWRSWLRAASIRARKTYGYIKRLCRKKQNDYILRNMYYLNVIY